MAQCWPFFIRQRHCEVRVTCYKCLNEFLNILDLILSKAMLVDQRDTHRQNAATAVDGLQEWSNLWLVDSKEGHSREHKWVHQNATGPEYLCSGQNWTADVQCRRWGGDELFMIYCVQYPVQLTMVAMDGLGVFLWLQHGIGTPGGCTGWARE